MANNTGPHPTMRGGVKRARQRKAQRLAALERRHAVLTRFLTLVGDKHPAPQLQLARELGIGPSRVSRILDAAYEDWRELCAERVDQIVEESLRDFAWVKAEASEQWERSKQDAQTTVTEKVAGPGGAEAAGRARVQKTVKVRTGDPRYLQVILDARDKLIKLTVGYKPQALDVRIDPRQELADLLGVSVDQLPAAGPVAKDTLH